MKKCFSSIAFLLCLILNTQNSFASVLAADDVQPLVASHEDFHYPDYYQVKEDPRVAIVDLMNFAHLQQELPYPTVAYNRQTQFGTWINYPGDNLCLNTRNKILVRESTVAVTYTPTGCAVQTGQWHDPYTDTDFTATKDIQIDHLVPLKNAYMTGAFEWDQNKRCLYANYLGNSFHLLAVNSHQNMAKGDNSPAEYMPPNKNYGCQYLKEWLEVKVIWGLRVTPNEFSGIQKVFEADKCDRGEFKISAADLTVQRHFMEDNKDLCQRTDKNLN